MNRKIIHIDMDCFYAAIEMRENPSLQNIPMAVGGKAERRGVLTTANYIARQYGVHSAMPTAKALQLCPTLTVIPGRLPFYKEVSLKIHQILQKYTHIIEPISLDEAYLDVSACTQFNGSATLIAKDIRKQIEQNLQLTASAGIAPIKFLAKIASDINKPNNQYTITPEDIPAFIATLPLSKIPGVGKVTAMKLEKLGLFNCTDVQQYDLPKLIHLFGKFGYILYERCHGLDPREVNHHRLRKSVGVEKTLINDIYSWEECLNIMQTLYPELKERLIKVSPNLLITKQGVKFKFSNFQSTTQEHSCQQLDQDYLLQIAKNTWDTRRQNRGIRLVGLHVTLPNTESHNQLSLF
ncbi:DNA polymerase IV [Neisseria sp. Ec49-e6-T10]|uniref:DNA polymerase IV n=1 Tax=Neisseria sp. Ec49-e6-T10 TaxID=3140744 RepID=UPI003EB6D1BC